MVNEGDIQMRVRRYGITAARYILAVMVTASCPMIAAAGEPIQPFVFVQQRDLSIGEHGYLMACPAHDHGSGDEAFFKLQRLVQETPGQEITSIWVCRANQIETLRQFAPVVDRIYINPFTDRSTPSDTEPILPWPNVDHPVLNRLRALRQVASETRLIACINVLGEPGLFKKRSATWEEVKWMALAIIGAGYEGIVWRGELTTSEYAGQIEQLETALAPYLPELGEAQAVDWMDGDSDQACSVLAARNTLFIVLLDKSYLMVTSSGEAIVPLSGGLHSASENTVHLTVPEGIRLENAWTLSGHRVRIVQNESDGVQIQFPYHGLGEILILPLRGVNDGAPDMTGLSR